VRVNLHSELVVPANSEVTERRYDESILPISSAPSDARGGPAWIVAGVCALAISGFVSLRLKPVEASAPVEPEWAAPPPAAATQTVTPEPAAPPAANEDEVNKVLQQAMPLVNGAAQAEPVAEQNAPVAAPQAEPAQTQAPAAPVQSKWALHKARREERQRRGHEFTLALNLAGAAEQASPQPAPSPVAQAPSAPAAPAPAAEPLMTQAPVAPKSPIPDNPY
jgi:hypothetical protein